MLTGMLPKLRTSSNALPKCLKLVKPFVRYRSSRPSIMSKASEQLFVSPQWLSERLVDKSDIVVLDTTWYLPSWGKDAASDFKQTRIPGSHFFDIDGVSDSSLKLPHMLPTEAQFSAAADALGIGNETTVVLYDRLGLYSAPRVWYTFKVLGHDKVSILEGGLPAWVKGGFPLEDTPATDSQVQLTRVAAQQATASTKYKASKDVTKVRTLQQVWDNICAPAGAGEQLVDARSTGRFVGTEPEPRAGMRGGHIPGALNVPFDAVLEGGLAGGKLKSQEEVLSILKSAGVDLERPIVGQCGTGLTACVVILAIYSATGKLVNLFDGSWVEWALHPDTPAVTTSS